jgi:hypothetical protein
MTALRGSPRVFPPLLRHASGVIATVVAHGHFPTIDDLEFIEMVEGNGDLIFYALYSNSDLDPNS